MKFLNLKRSQFSPYLAFWVSGNCISHFHYFFCKLNIVVLETRRQILQISISQATCVWPISVDLFTCCQWCMSAHRVSHTVTLSSHTTKRENWSQCSPWVYGVLPSQTNQFLSFFFLISWVFSGTLTRYRADALPAEDPSSDLMTVWLCKRIRYFNSNWYLWQNLTNKWKQNNIFKVTDKMLEFGSNCHLLVIQLVTA